MKLGKRNYHMKWAALRINANPYDLYVGIRISHLHTSTYHESFSVLIALVGSFNKEEALVGAFLVIVNTDGSFAALLLTWVMVTWRTGNRVILSQFSLNCGQASHSKSWGW